MRHGDSDLVCAIVHDLTYYKQQSIYGFIQIVTVSSRPLLTACLTQICEIFLNHIICMHSISILIRGTFLTVTPTIQCFVWPLQSSLPVSSVILVTHPTSPLQYKSYSNTLPTIRYIISPHLVKFNYFLACMMLAQATT